MAEPLCVKGIRPFEPLLPLLYGPFIKELFPKNEKNTHVFAKDRN